MKTLNYGNSADTTGNRKPLVVTNNIFEEVISKCEGRYGFGGEDKNSFYVDVNDWNKCLEVVNEGIKYGNYPYVLKKRPFIIK